MSSIRGDKTRGPDSLVTVTNAQGLANSDAAPTIAMPTMRQLAVDAHKWDIQTAILIEMRVISRLLAENNNVTEDLDIWRADEEITLSIDAAT